MKWHKNRNSIVFSFNNSAKVVVLLACLFFGRMDNLFATHAAGADLTYTSLGGLVYQVDATFYRDCGGTLEPGNVTISYKSATCGYTRTALANKLPNNNGTEITLPCPSSPSTCNGGSSSGIRKWVYRTIITLPEACSDWVFSYRICCRNCSITTVQAPCATGSELYVEATLNNLAAPGNSSPTFSNIPIAFVCLAQNFNYNQGVYDINGDSISYELITPKTSATTEVAFISPATPQAPVVSSSPFVLDVVTGDINFTASSLQISILAVRVKEFRNGQLIGSTIRDMQVYVQNCFNAIPVASGINGTSNFIISACANQQLCFTIHTSDSDTNQNVGVSISNPIQGSTITQTPGNRPEVQFCWTPNQNDISPNPKTFTVTVYDNACPYNGVQTFSYTIFVQAPSVNLSSVNPSCFGGNNGSASATAIGIGPFNYLWNTNPSQNTITATGLSSGNYSVTVTDSIGCSSTANTTITDPPQTVTASCAVSGINSCQAGNNASILTTVAGGYGPYSYQWNNGASTASLSALGAGTYTVTVTDSHGCTSLANGIIPQAAGSISATITVNSNVLCYGGNAGNINLAVSGGTQPYSFQWSNGSASQNQNGLVAGNYSVIISDVNGCSTTTNTTITQPSAPLQIAMNSLSDVNCYGANTGSISIAPSGGTSPYQFLWNNNATTQNVNNLAAGMYIVTVTDLNGCNSLMTFTISEPQMPLIISPVSVTDITCSPGSFGSINISVNGGTHPYTFLWSNSTTTEDITNLAAGNYTVTVTDNLGCTNNSSFTISDNSASIIVSVNNTQNVLCFNGANGFIDLNVVGGQAPFSYLWSNGMTTEDLTGLVAGNYSVAITDVNGCIANFSTTINQPSSPLIPQIENSHSVNCYGDSSGSFSLIINGGTAPYSFMWSNGSAIQNPSGLTAGIYTLTVTDANGCNAILSDSILQPNNPILLNLTVHQPVSCDSLNSGSIVSSVSGGTPPYSYLWSNGSTNSQINTLVAGNYSVTITDQNGCTAIASIHSTGLPNAIQVSGTIVHPNCNNGQLGSITLNVSGGIPGYSFVWNNGVHTASINGLTPGMYNVIVTDSAGCTATQSFEIKNYNTIFIHLSGPPTICSGDMITLFVDSVPGFAYQWYYANLPLNGATSNTFSTPAAGTYSVAVTTGCGTIMSNQVNVTVQSVENASISNNQIICPPDEVHLFATGGATYSWTPSTNITFTNVPDPIVNPIVSTTYSVTITNELGCKTDLSVNVAVMCDSLLVPTGFSPNDDGTNDGYVIHGIANYPGNKLWVYNRWGNLVYKAKDYDNSWNGVSNVSGNYIGKKVPTGTYYYILDLNDGSKPQSGYIIIRR